MIDTATIVAALSDDPRVLGIALREGRHGLPHVVVACTWDGLDGLVQCASALAAQLVGDASAAVVLTGSSAEALAADGSRATLEVRQIAALTPAADGEAATALHDPQGLIAQWAKWSRGRPDRDVPDSASAAQVAAADAKRLLDVDSLTRALSGPALSPGAQIVRDDGSTGSLRQRTGEVIRLRLGSMEQSERGAAVRERAAAALASIPRSAGGVRVAGAGEASREAFLAVADDEGFRGDRPLLAAAEERLSALEAGRAPTFAEGFALATFDQVEARYALGDAVGGCQPPLVPGIYVGIGVTPGDALEFWAAPCVSEPMATYACVGDDGERCVVPRSAGRDALFGALTDAVDAAHEALPSFLKRARGAHYEPLADPAAALSELHLPRSFVAAASQHGALRPGTSRLLAALALARAAHDMDPVVGRKLALGAGRLLLAATPLDPDSAAPGDCAG